LDTEGLIVGIERSVSIGIDRNSRIVRDWAPAIVTVIPIVIATIISGISKAEISEIDYLHSPINQAVSVAAVATPLDARAPVVPT
jgi:hypothetical protein